jgi:hypothetical protein
MLVLHGVFHGERDLLDRLLHITEGIAVVLQRTRQDVTDSILLIGEYFVEHIGCTGFEMEGIFWLIQHLLRFLQMMD